MPSLHLNVGGKTRNTDHLQTILQTDESISREQSIEDNEDSRKTTGKNAQVNVQILDENTKNSKRKTTMTLATSDRSRTDSHGKRQK